MFIGIDLGTSGVKAILMDENGDVLASQNESLSTQRPLPLWSEQDPDAWWQATDRALLALGKKHPLGQVKALGLAGQMHGAVLLDGNHKVLRPAILWNDGRCAEECAILEECVPDSRRITGNLMMPGFTAPKVLWVRRHEPKVFEKIRKILLPKDYLRFIISGDFASDMSDAAGTLWLDVAKRDWSDTLLAACGIDRSYMPALYEGNQTTGAVLPTLCQRWGLPQQVAVVAGAGDNAAGAVGVGMINAGSAMLSLGTSGVYFAVTDGFRADPESAVHSFCHCLPQRWHLMSVMLSAASCLDWTTKLLGIDNVEQLMSLAQRANAGIESVYFLPYLSGERTPHNNPNAKGVFFGMTHQHGQAELAKAVLEGIGFALAEGIDAVHGCGIQPENITLIGGGARSPFWRQMLADITGLVMDFCTGGDIGPALGAARLAQASTVPAEQMTSCFKTLTLSQRHIPDLHNHQSYRLQRKVFGELYQRLSPMMK